MEYVSVIKQGMLTTIQDLGRHAYRALGVSTCGVMDRLSYKLANILVGNELDQAVLEVTLIGPRLRFNQLGVIAITGGNLTPTINGEDVPMFTSIFVQEGDELSFGKCNNGVRAYISFAGGINVPRVMGSRSTFMRGNYGGIKGGALKKGDAIPLGKTSIDFKHLSGRKIRYQDIPNYEDDRPIRFILGPQDKRFSPESVEGFMNQSYTITNAADRMGYQLEGPMLHHVSGADIASDFITPGTIQVPGSQQPIIHMADCGTTGGYTKMGVIIGADLPYVAQKKPGDTIRFQPVEVLFAQAEWKRQAQLLQSLQINNKLLLK